MEGREQKHQAISKYAHNTTFQNRWPAIFRHEYIHLIYLRKNGFDLVNYRKKHVSYVPDIDKSISCSHCCLTLKNGLWELCSNEIMGKVKKLVSER